ncbi:MAG: DUF4836 family protein [Bacteroidota bacterium]|nr:DUF4836 family protein [Bacteroidota bacterium]
MKRLPILAIAFFLLTLSSCKNKSGLFIPTDAVAVVHVNPSSLSSKISWSDIKNSDWFKEMHSLVDDTLTQKVLDNPEAAGMDVKNDFFFFIAQSGSNGYSIIEGNIKDAKLFEGFNLRMNEKNRVQTDGNYKIIMMEDSSSLVAWNDKKFAYIHNRPELGMHNSFGNRREDGNNTNSFGADSLRLVVKSVLNNEGTSLHDDDRFEGLMKETGDVHLWLNSSSVMKSIGGGYTDMMKVSAFQEGNATGAALVFEDGKITIKAKSFLNKELAKLMDKYDSKNISADILKRLPSQNVMGVMATNINPQTVREILKAAGFEGLANSALSKKDVTLDDIFTAVNGQFLFTVSDVQMKDSIMSFPGEDGKLKQTIKVRNPDYTILVASGVNNQASFQKLLDMAISKNGPAPFYYKLSNQWFAAGNKPASVDAFMAGGSNQQPWADKLTGHPFGMYINLQKIFTSHLSEDSTMNAFMIEAAAVWQDIVASGGEIKNGTSTAEFVVNMIDKKTNSLKQLNTFLSRMNDVKNKMMRRNMDDDMHDNMFRDSLASPTKPLRPAIDPAN